MNAIVVRNLSKRYRMQGSPRADTLRDVVAGIFKGQRAERSGDRDFWALRGVSFEVAEGEAVGIIGRNGAGKSTLLKILSRIVEPTSGSATMRGRVASLLEVGTGFHPELTGRENIYLSGTILGMKRSEITRAFDGIVAFSDVEQFLDTPVKHYSSGMHVRLAFAVAAYLTPEILIVDEVLAVGDHEFQRRCLGRMNEVAHSGRTVMFVSHNMMAVEALCPRSILMRGGTIASQGPTGKVVSEYLSVGATNFSWDTRALTEREGTGNARIVRVELRHHETNAELKSLVFRQSFRVRVHYEALDTLPNASFGFAFLSERGDRVFQTETAELNHKVEIVPGKSWMDCVLKAPNLLPGRYLVEAWVVEHANVAFADHLFCVGQLDIIVDPMQQEQMAYLTYPGRGRVLMDCEWSAARKNEIHVEQ